MKEFWISVDLGYGQVKGVNELGKKIIFPSILSPGKDRSLDKFFNRLDENIADNLHVTISDNNYNNTTNDYFVGKLAQRSNTNSYFNTTDNKIYSNENKVFLATLAGLLMPKGITEEYALNVITGLPVSHFVKQRAELETMIKNLNITVDFPDHNIKQHVKFNKVLLMPQGAGALNYVLLNNGQKYYIRNTYIGLIDIGFKTTDIVVFKINDNGKLEFISDMSSTLENIGMSIIYTEMDKIFVKASRNGESLSVDRLMELCRNGKIFYNGSFLDLTKELKKLKDDVACSIVNNIDTLWTSSAKSAFNSVILAGGGGAVLYPYIKPKLGVCSVALSNNAEFANTFGYLSHIKKR
ncbi:MULTISPECIES: ParM/StbA family protein [Clostridium]|mgnify:FL=1|jgi:plasmid segregation protein ParM|uniref:ParM/StbA family protein n=1 Tax=Clostridium TaxID=1485 RepID=UPI00242B9424|nr:ParM/StbA family protein [Clostridium tyrobutyricum]